MKRYWPQHRVFFIATLALFPEKLNGYAVNPWFYWPYFLSEELDVIKIELEDYKNAGYLKYKGVDGLYEISNIDTQRAADDLKEYLKKWKHDELLSLPASKPPDVAYQQTLLLNAIARVYVSNQKEPRITLRDVYGKPSDYSYTPPFWELVLSCQLLDEKVKIKYMDYDRQEGGLYDNDAQPLVDFKIIDKKLLGLIEQRVEQKAEPAPTDIAMTVTEQRAWITMPKKHVVAELANGDKYTITKQKTGLKTDLAPYTIMKQLTKHPTIPITLKYAKEKLDGCESVDNLSEVIRQCGFDEAKKDMFFEVSTAQKVKLKDDVRLSTDDVSLLVN